MAHCVNCLVIISARGSVARVALPHKHKSNRKPYQEYYDEESKALVEELFKEDIETFGYKFEEA